MVEPAGSRAVYCNVQRAGSRENSSCPAVKLSFPFSATKKKKGEKKKSRENITEGLKMQITLGIGPLCLMIMLVRSYNKPSVLTHYHSVKFYSKL